MWGIRLLGQRLDREVQQMPRVAEHVNKITIFTTFMWKDGVLHKWWGVSMFGFFYTKEKVWPRIVMKKVLQMIVANTMTIHDKK